MRYYYANAANQPVGPLEVAEISSLAEAGTITEQTHVIAEGSQTWVTYAELRQSINVPPPPPNPGPFVAPPAPHRGLGSGAKIALVTSIVAVIAAAAGVLLWQTVLNRPSKSAITAFVTDEMNQRFLQVQSVKIQTARAESGNVRVSYVAQVATKEPLYVTVDTQKYLQEQMGVDADGLVDAQERAKNVDPSELASLGAPPTDPLSVVVLKPGTPAGTVLSYSGSLMATKSEKGWSLTEVEGGQFSPHAPEGTARSDIQGQSFVIGNDADQASLKTIVDQATAYANKVAEALPADLPAGVKTMVKLAKAGVSEDMMLAQAQTDGTAYKLTAAQIIYLHKVGVPQNVIKALLEGYQPPSQPVSEEPSQPSAEPAQATPEPTPAPQPPAVTTISVPANGRWMDTGVDLAPGQPFSIAASGLVSVSARIPINIPFLGNHFPVAATQTPDGSPSDGSNDPFHPYVAPGLAAYSLVGKVADSVPFEIGSNATISAPAGGRLYLSVNANSFENNTGLWNVTITLPQTSAPAAAPTSQFSGQPSSATVAFMATDIDAGPAVSTSFSSDGYDLYGTAPSGTANNSFVGAFQAGQRLQRLPGYVASITAPVGFDTGSAGGFQDYSLINDPTNPGSQIEAGLELTHAPGPNMAVPLVTINLSTQSPPPPVFYIGFMTNIHAGRADDFPATITIQCGGSQASAPTGSSSSSADGRVSVFFFSISGAHPGDTITVSASQSIANPGGGRFNPSVSGLLFTQNLQPSGARP